MWPMSQCRQRVCQSVCKEVETVAGLLGAGKVTQLISRSPKS